MKCKLSNFPNQSGNGSSVITPTKERYFTDQEIRDLYIKEFNGSSGQPHTELLNLFTQLNQSLKGTTGGAVVADKVLEYFQSSNYDKLEEFYPYFHGAIKG